jgi:hypothetical protein
LREDLVARFGEERVPSIEALTDWLGRHSERRARGKLTTAGIVTAIILYGKLIPGLRNRQQTLDYVGKAIRRARR